MSSLTKSHRFHGVQEHWTSLPTHLPCIPDAPRSRVLEEPPITAPGLDRANSPPGLQNRKPQKTYKGTGTPSRITRSHSSTALLSYSLDVFAHPEDILPILPKTTSRYTGKENDLKETPIPFTRSRSRREGQSGILCEIRVQGPSKSTRKTPNRHKSGRVISEDQTNTKMGSTKENPTKRKATEEPGTPSDRKRAKSSKSIKSDSEEPEKKVTHVVPFLDKPAVIEERNGGIEFRVVNNDNKRESMIILSGLKCIFQKQLPKMPKDYIARLVYDRTHLSMAIIKKPLEVVGGITYRPFKGRHFAEIVFCAVSSDQQVKGYGAHLMSHLKDYVKATSDVMHFLTYADNYAIGYFKKQGFTKEITLERPVWMGYIKDYEGGTIMQCSMLDKVRYLEQSRMLLKQKEAVWANIRAFSKSHEVHQPPKEWRNGDTQPIDPMSIAAIAASGWSREMDELARQPRHGPNYNILLHLLNDMQNHASAWPFLQPVNRDDVADYYEVIKEPMDLATMEVKLEADNYGTPEEFIRDSKLVFDNCRKYNNETTPYAKSATKLEKFMWAQIKQIPEWSHLEP